MDCCNDPLLFTEDSNLYSPPGLEPGHLRAMLVLNQRREELERIARIELATTAWKAEVLPLNYIRKKGSCFKRAFRLTADELHITVGN